NLDWTDESGDGFKEPLLDVSTFSPTLIPSAGDGGGDEGGGGDGGTVGWGLQATGRKVKGSQAVDLAWATAAAGDATAVDVYRDGARIAAGTANDGAYTDSIGRKGGGSYTYQVCGGGTCSAEVTVTF
ncbi:MAG: hypothetical protein M3469_08120, partial [Actinomycetota bacterium]|nr:hypothetical protein [Actinomycetota bacterium]